ncbi:MAG: hypothetical protein ABIC68_05290 [Candidatus Omnitrophota bacterium]
MLKQILCELRCHAPFTIFGAATGIVVMFFFQRLPYDTAFNVFYVLHPLHVFLSALVTASMYKLHQTKCVESRCSFWYVLLIGFFGSVGIATLSDSVIPYIGEALLKMPNRHAHIGFIEEWWLVNPLAILGVIIAYWKPTTKIPHSGHVLLSTWASLFHIIMALGVGFTWYLYAGTFLFLFLAVWLPCCFSDIVFPLLFVRDSRQRGKACVCEH